MVKTYHCSEIFVILTKSVVFEGEELYSYYVNFQQGLISLYLPTKTCLLYINDIFAIKCKKLFHK